MIAYLKGKLISATLDYIIMEVGGVGYKVFTPASLFGTLPEPGEELVIHTHHYVREDAIQLYGFENTQDLAAFELLLGISGVGPKVALAVLSVLNYQQLHQAIIQENLPVLNKIPGIGKKTAQRLVLELKDKLSKAGANISPTLGLQTLTGAGAPLSPAEDGISALESLGYQHNQARLAIQQALNHYGEAAAVEDLIKGALKTLAKL
ncbi:MAG: Holliday junction branch migration protein RuvA [Carboxydocellales bacterium]